MSDIEQAREILKDLLQKVLDSDGDFNARSKGYINQEINRALALMYREKAKRRTPVQSARFDKEMAKAIRKMADKRPDLSQQTIAQFFHVNPGRVSEALAMELTEQPGPLEPLKKLLKDHNAYYNEWLDSHGLLDDD